ncbi:type II toxin-antitoxin system ParD family antitoxin [Methylobacterium sp. SyP6R]|uniref:type II toxin-antitoxin system ParD family antitoxin n=1 Tax=Methylobacterium sp. SyP6R TaxID=2718876 RepID=UPI001EFF70F9|nr:type II toxin-antitoxin system ParD family antitoxin [Methylobacterium sp. SyP6R]MCF4126129.1 type II toxin-antitoxin system ParD family antitoxin [Methylobacterium sp. SyP6R]
MTRTLTITLDDDLVAFIDRRIASGRSASAGEVIEAGLRLLEAHDTARDGLRAAGSGQRAALIEGEASRGFEDFDADRFLASMRRPALS